MSHWIYSPFVAENFFNSILKNQGEEYIFEIFNGKTDNDLIYRSSKLEKSKSDVGLEKVINIYGQDFLIRWARSVNFVSSSDFLSTWIGFIGAISIILIILFFCNIYLTEEKASKLAEEYIHEYSLAQDKIRQQESKLVDSARLVSLGEMAGNIAHEINTPLAVISINAQLLNKYISNLTSKQENANATEHVAKILATIKKISNIIQGLRKISRNANGDKMSMISSRQLVEETMTFCTERLKNLDIHFTYSDRFASDIYCREVEMSQVLVNLINNSVDAISHLPNKWINIDITSINSFIRIRVTDSGDGIPKHLRDKILLPFFTTKEIGKGTGIGLSISKGIIESHGGRFYLDTDHPNTSFVIELPISNLQRLSA